ncbi:MAG: HPr family phosphocarrier protein [Lysobacterales bacterium]
MVEQEIVVSNRLGLHARAAAKLVQLVGRYSAKVMLLCRGREVNAQSILGVMMLAAGKGTSLVIRADGADEGDALAAVVELFNRRFDEAD